MSSLFDYLSKSSKEKLNKQTEADLKAERDGGSGGKSSVWGQSKSTSHAARQNAGRPGEQGLQPRASAAPNKAHNNPNHTKSERKLCAKSTKREERRMGFIPRKIRETRETSKSKQLGSTTPRNATPTHGYDAPPGFDRRSWTIADGIGNGHAWGMIGGSKIGGLRYSQPQPVEKSDMEHNMYVGEAYGGVDYIYGKK